MSFPGVPGLPPAMAKKKYAIDELPLEDYQQESLNPETIPTGSHSQVSPRNIPEASAAEVNDATNLSRRHHSTAVEDHLSNANPSSMATPRNDGARDHTVPVIDDNDSGNESSSDILVHGTDYPQYGTSREPSADRSRRRSFIEEDREPLQLEIPAKKEKKEKPVTWSSLPNKSQLAILVIARLSEPLVQSSLRVSKIPE
jgi:hypothetical protein